VGLRAGLDVEKRKMLPLPRIELRPLGRPARIQSLYRLRYPGSYGPIAEQKVWRIRIIRELGELYRIPDMVADIEMRRWVGKIKFEIHNVEE
jgi:hypothetical protein